jgi:hypothetical protein
MPFLCVPLKRAPFCRAKDRRLKDKVQQQVSGLGIKQASTLATAEAMPASVPASSPSPTFTYGPCTMSMRRDPCLCSKGTFAVAVGPVEDLPCLNCKHPFRAHDPTNDSSAVPSVGCSADPEQPKVKSLRFVPLLRFPSFVGVPRKLSEV